MQRLTLDEMKSLELDITDEIHRICEEHGLRYFLAYGSLIGAMRHQGFIPWDDDVDLHMFREDYETLARNFDAWKSDDRFTILSPVLGNSVYSMAKVVDTTTVVKQSYVRSEYSTGIWVDIFPLDYDRPGIEEEYRKLLSLGRKRYLAITDPKAPSKSLVTTIGKRIACRFSSALDAKKIAREMDGIAKHACAEPTAMLATFSEVSAMPPYMVDFDATCFEQQLVPFEDRFYYAPKGYDAVLTALFGDWRTPVQEESHTAEAYRLEGSEAGRL